MKQEILKLLIQNTKLKLQPYIQIIRMKNRFKSPERKSHIVNPHHLTIYKCFSINIPNVESETIFILKIFVLDKCVLY